MKKFSFFILVCAAALVGCGPSQHVQSSYYTPSTTAEGVVIGAGVGAIVGTMTKSALIGTTLVGAVVGGIIGSQLSAPTLAQKLNDHGVLTMVRGDTVRILLSSDLIFEAGTPNIRGDQYPTLDYLAGFLKKYGCTPIMIKGYTDYVGTPEYNRYFSLQQARSVLTYLWVHGVQFEHMYAKGMGEKYPVSNPRYVLRNKYNRRIEITLRAGCPNPSHH